MLRRLTIFTVVCGLFATSALAQDGRARRVEQKPAAAVGAPRPEPATSLALASVPFAPGETLSYDVEWNNNTTAATLVLSVGQRGTYFGQEGLELSADVATVGMVRLFASVQANFKSYSDPKTILPFRSDSQSKVNGKAENRTVLFDRAKSVALVNSQSTPIGADTGDPLSLFYRVRGLSLKVGDSTTLDGFVQRREQWKVVVEAREAISTANGKANAFRVAFMPIKGGQPDDRNKIRVWFTDTAARLPVLITAQPEFGPLKLTLTETRGTKG